VTEGKPIAVRSQSVSVASEKKERCHSFVLSRTPHENHHRHRIAKLFGIFLLEAMGFSPLWHEFQSSNTFSTTFLVISEIYLVIPSFNKSKSLTLEYLYFLARKVLGVSLGLAFIVLSLLRALCTPFL
jgi:hypothetical protein